MVDIGLILLVSFAACLLLNVPIVVALALASALGVWAFGGDPASIIAARMTGGVDSFALLAIPFFVLAGNLMGRGGMAARLIDLASALVGRFPGGLACVNTVACMLFGSISGSAAAAVSSIGGAMIPGMVRKGYPRAFATALTATSATTGLIIPPSNIMIVYSVSAGSVSIASLFLAGVLPGILVGICLIVAALIAIRRMDVKPEAAASLSEVLVALRRSVLSLALIFIVLGGILSGLMTATEAAAIAAAYSFILTVVVYREVTPRMLPEIFRSSAQTTAVVLCLVAACSALSWILTTVNIPHAVSDALLGISSQPLVVLLIINLILIVVGTFMDMTPAVLIFTPIFLPVVTGLGINEIHFGIIMIANLCIGLCTPPVGSCLFIGCGVGRASILDVSRAMIPFFAAMIVSLVIISLWPALSLWLPALVRP